MQGTVTPKKEEEEEHASSSNSHTHTHRHRPYWLWICPPLLSLLVRFPVVVLPAGWQNDNHRQSFLVLFFSPFSFSHVTHDVLVVMTRLDATNFLFLGLKHASCCCQWLCSFSSSSSFCSSHFSSLLFLWYPVFFSFSMFLSLLLFPAACRREAEKEKKKCIKNMNTNVSLSLSYTHFRACDA